MYVSPPLVSVIIPTKNSSRTLGACLQSIKDQTYPHIEIIVVDNFSTDSSCEIAKQYSNKVFQHGSERSTQRNYGVIQSLGTYLLIIDSDMKLSTSVVSDCVAQLQLQKDLKGLVIPEESFGTGFWSQCKKLERSLYVGVDRMEAARFFTKQVFEEIGGYDENNIGTEDYDLPQRIQEKYGETCIGRIVSYIYHDEGNLNLWKTCKKKFYYGQRLSAYIIKKSNLKNFKKQSNILKRYLLFFRKPKELCKNPLICIGMIRMKTVEIISGASGYIIGKFRKLNNIYQ